MTAQLSIHRAVDSGIELGGPNFRGGKLVCKCSEKPVEIEVHANSSRNHVCGCTKCWKPQGARFSMVAVVPREKLDVMANGDKLRSCLSSETYSCRAHW